MSPTERATATEGDVPSQAPSAFDPLGALDDPLLALEASAGTGKTYALSTIAARSIAEGEVVIRDLLVVTFTRAAAAELRDRLRGRLGEFAAALEHAAGSGAPGAPADEHDPVLVEVCKVDPALRAQRVRDALADFDAATITTIHGFAQHVIGTLGSTSRSDPDAVLVADTDELIAQGASDALLTEILTGDDPALELVDLDMVRRGAALKLNNPGSRFVPALEDLPFVPPGSRTDQEQVDAAARITVGLVEDVAARVQRHRQLVGTMSFDDLLVRLRDILTDVDTGEAARRTLRARFDLALIDEFQDTDPVQWEVFQMLFVGTSAPGSSGSGAMVLVGDPKQAIYAFRGANVHTYLQAIQTPGTALRNLTTNWRSDERLLESTASLLRGTTFGANEITFAEVSASAAGVGRSITGADGESLPAISLRCTIGDAVDRLSNGKRGPRVGSASAHTFVDLAHHIRELLETASIPDLSVKDSGEGPAPQRRLRPDDIAVLVAKNVYGPEVRDALAALGIPAVISRGDSVLKSQAATHWHRLFAAIARPTDPRRVRAACSTWFVGLGAEGIAALSDEELIAHQERLHEWGGVLVRDGVAAMLGQIFADTSVAERVLALAQGERHMTDLDHLAELMCNAVARNTSPAGLLESFEELGVRAEDGDPETDIAARRVESENAAVQIMTTFVAKGLEFPVVCCPTLWDSAGTAAYDHIWWDDHDATRVVDLVPKLKWSSEADCKQRKMSATDELAGTNLRLLYVALTRARHHSAIWWSPTNAAWKTGLAKVLFARDDTGAIDPELFAADSAPYRSDEDSLASLGVIAAASEGAIEVVEVGTADQALDVRPWAGSQGQEPANLEIALLGRSLDRSRQRWSFTAITARRDGASHAAFDLDDDNLGDAGAGDEAADNEAGDNEAAGDEAAGDELNAEPGESGADDLLPLGSIAGGATFGTLVHEVLERVDFASDTLADDLGELIAERLRFNPWPVDQNQLVTGLESVLDTPLGTQFDDRALRSFERRDRLDELDFDLHLPDRAGRVSDQSIGALVLEHLSPGDPYRPWAQHLASGRAHSELAGHLNGSIDLITRVRGTQRPDRFVVVDYKTNRLSTNGATPTAAAFAAAELPEVMARSDYPLQALLYSVALHRYLRWRVRDYDPALHLGGIAYLFVRGMTGPDTPTTDGVPNGIARWMPPPALIEALSEHLAGNLAVSTQAVKGEQP